MQGIDEQTRQKAQLKRALNMINKSITSTSIKEKNDILSDIIEIWTPQVEALETLQKKNSIRADGLTQMRKNLSTITEEISELTTNTSFYQKAEQVRFKHPDQNLIKSIKATESEILKFNPLQTSNRLSEILSLPSTSDKRLFTLIDLNLKRLEELAFETKKRLDIVEDSQENTDLVTKEFGSVNDLIEKVHHLEIENQKLRKDEAKFMSDPITRRRKFGQITPNATRSLINISQSIIRNEQKNLQCYLDKFQDSIQIEMEKGTLVFSDICGDPNFDAFPDHFEQSDFTNTIDPEQLQSLVSGASLEAKLSAFPVILQQSEATIQKLEREIAAGNSKISFPISNPTTRVEKLIEANSRLFTRVNKLSAQLTQQLADIDSHTTQISEILNQKFRFIERYSEFLKSYQRLTADHSVLLKKRSRNLTNLNSLLRIATSMGHSLFDKQNFKNNELEQYIAPPFQELCAKLEEENRIQQASISTESEDEQKVSSANPTNPPAEAKNATQFAEKFGLLRNRNKRNKPKKSLTSLKELTDNESTLTSSVVEIKVSTERKDSTEISLFDNRTRLEMLNALALMYDLGGFVLGKKGDYRFQKAVGYYSKQILEEMCQVARQQIEAFGEPFKSSVSRIEFSGNRILVKAKEIIGIQTEKTPKADQESQTEETSPSKAKRK